MSDIFSGQTADKVWRRIFESFRNTDTTSVQESRRGPTRELLHVHFHIENPLERWIHSRIPAINPAFALAEVFWILSGSNDAHFINFWNPALPKFSGTGDHYHGAYGHRIKNQFGIDQLECAYNVLKNNPDSRQVIIQIWDPRTDLPNEDGTPKSPDIPCNICSLPKIRNGRLEWLQIMRSNDFYLGMPYNVVQFTTLQEILAGWLGVEVGAYHQVSDSLHVYESDLTKMDISSSQSNIRNTDKLAVTRNEFDSILDKVFTTMQKLTNKNLNKKTFQTLVDIQSLPEGYRNILLITAADSARRRKWDEEMLWASDKCTNPALTSLWNAWLFRRENKN